MTLHLGVCTWTGAFVELEPKEPSTTLDIFKALALGEIQDPLPHGCQIAILHNDRPLLGETSTLAEQGLRNGDILTFKLVPSAFSEIDDADADAAGKQTMKSDVTFIRDQLLSRPDQVMLLQKTNPPLAQALLMGDFETFSDLVAEILCKAEKIRDAKLEQALRDIGEWPSPMSMTPHESLLLIVDVNENVVRVPKKHEMNPLKNVRGGLTTLYVNTKVNGYNVKAYVDPGAKFTTMSKGCANRTKIFSLLESSSPAAAATSGKTYLMLALAAASTSPLPKSVGKIRNFNIEIAGKFIISTFTVVEVQKWELILGQDLLKAHECVIDLGQNLLKIGSSGSGVSTPFILECPKIPSPRIPKISPNLKEANPPINSN